jgi:glycosyltransferase involved in cell wall biosynthesis
MIKKDIKKSLSKFTFIIPVFNNEKNIYFTYSKLKKFLYKNVNIIFINDGSTDKSLFILKKLYLKSPNKIKIIDLKKNFGQIIALIIGLNYVETKYTIILSCDLQDNIKALDKMFYFSNNYDLIVSNRFQRQENIIDKFFSYCYWSLMQILINKNIPKTGYDFCCINNQNIKRRIDIQTPNLFVELYVISKKILILNGKRYKRKFGVSGWTIKKKIELFINSFLFYIKKNTAKTNIKYHKNHIKRIYE